MGATFAVVMGIAVACWLLRTRFGAEHDETPPVASSSEEAEEGPSGDGSAEH